MSLILEALRKSEAERRQGVAPDLLQPELVPAPAATPRVPRWAWLAPLLLALPLLWWWQHDTPPSASALRDTGKAAPARPVAGPGRSSPPLPPVERLQATLAPSSPSRPRERAVPAPMATPATSAPPPPSTPPAPSASVPTEAPDGDPVLLGALAPALRQALPPLQLSMHLWNEDPARRVAILDGRRVAVGDRVGPATVAEIRPEGVLLDWNGRQVLVPLR